MTVIEATELTKPDWPIMVPFGILLVAIALGPVVAQQHWQRHYHRLCVGLAAVVCLYYVLVLRQPGRVVHASLDYLSFIVIVGSSFVVSGGIHLRIKSPSGPLKNTIFLLFGAALANVIGTIGASMLLIRPWLGMNRNRNSPFHIAFFIFLVSNVGGALLPMGPPLILGYLKHVPFRWPLEHCWPHWVLTTALLLLVFFVWDSIDQHTHRTRTSTAETDLTAWRCDGAHNFIFLLVILAAVVAAPEGWREPLMILTALGSYFATSGRIRAANEFSFAPLVEVAWLFLGIFGTMIPVLEFMQRSAESFGLHSDSEFFWATGFLSALLDNAPTYLAFFATALGAQGLDINESSDVAKFLAGNGHQLIAVSLGAAFFGALTYIGNAPNLLVKTIADYAQVRTPTFLSYILKFALPVLIPVFLLISILFFR